MIKCKKLRERIPAFDTFSVKYCKGFPSFGINSENI